MPDSLTAQPGYIETNTTAIGTISAASGKSRKVSAAQSGRRAKRLAIVATKATVRRSSELELISQVSASASRKPPPSARPRQGSGPGAHCAPNATRRTIHAIAAGPIRIAMHAAQMFRAVCRCTLSPSSSMAIC